MRHSR